MAAMDTLDAHPAPLWRRLAAGLGDAALLATATLLAGGPAVGTAVSPALLVPFAALAMFYRVLFEGSRLAATPGKLALGLRVTAGDGARLSFATAALRAWPWWLSGAVAGIAPSAVPVAALLSLAAIAAIPLGAARRGLHDRMAGTLVVTAGDHAGRDPAA